ncbi:MAG: hypothetical protein M1823_007216, partial [Watsoniomyces obsoletus]
IVPQADFTEGLYIDYRHFDKAEVEPLYPFGFGLSYTSFEYSNLKITAVRPKSSLPDARPSSLEAPSYDSSIPDPVSALFPAGIRKLKKYVYPYISDVNQVKEGSYPYPDGYGVHQEPSQAGGAEGRGFLGARPGRGGRRQDRREVRTRMMAPSPSVAGTDKVPAIAGRLVRPRYGNHPVLWRIASLALLFVAWEIAGLVPINVAFPTFSATLIAFFGMVFDGSMLKAYFLTLQPLVMGVAVSA